MVKYFAFGSNMKLEQMKSRANVYTFIPAKLHGFELVFNKQAKRNPKEGYANVVPKQDGIVEGVLYDLEDLVQLDKSEGVPLHYTKQVLEVVTSAGNRVRATVYVANESKVVEGLLPTREYVDKLLLGESLSVEYMEKIRSYKILE